MTMVLPKSKRMKVSLGHKMKCSLSHESPKLSP
jgi:hypothetical protein